MNTSSTKINLLKPLFIALFLCSSYFYLQAEEIVFKSLSVLPPKSAEWNIPAIKLGSNEKLIIGFDDVADRDLNLRYRIIHCNPAPNFPKSLLKEIEYLDGPNMSYVDKNDLSMSTRVNYVHYSFSIPGEYQRLKVSGVYKVEIFEASNPNTTLLTIPFLVHDPQVITNTSIGLPKNVAYHFSKQELKIIITPLANSSVRIIDPNRNLKVFVQQNLNIRTARQIPMQFSSGNSFIYKDSPELVFDGLNEYRNFDIRPLSYEGLNVERLELERDIWNVFIYNQNSRKNSSYIDNDDINGDFVVNARGVENSDIEADYAFVHFFLNMPFDPSSEYYLTGKFNQWKTDESNRLKYNPDLQLYTTSTLCKQGFYDYMFLQRKNGIDNYVPIEGNFQEAENDYYTFVFYSEPGGKYLQLIGIQKLNSRN